MDPGDVSGEHRACMWARLPGTTPTRGERARGMEHSQVGSWTRGAVHNPSARTGIASALLQQFGAAELGGEVRGSIHPTAVYVTRSPGGVVGRDCEVPSVIIRLGNAINHLLERLR